jgi:5-methylcytosine-specific restriction endonuclease McrA
MTDYSIKRYSEYSDCELIERLRTFALDTDTAYVSSHAFSESTGISEATITRHFGSWKVFCEQAGLAPRYQRSVSRQDLFRNLDCVWQELGRQPRAKEMKQPLSPISVSRYQKEFQEPWYNICLGFLSWKSGVSTAEIEAEAQATHSQTTGHSSRTTRREITLSLRYEVLKRDGFRCVKCGRSPATETGVQLHIDHLVPWANGGETVLGNLQCLCSDCNLGKSNRHHG